MYACAKVNVNVAMFGLIISSWLGCWCSKYCAWVGNHALAES